jgi:PAS domain S-box-containing protein
MAGVHARNAALEHLQALAEMAEGIASHSHGLTAASQAPDACAESKILDVALDCLERIVHPDRCSVLLYDLDGELRFKAWRNLSADIRRRMEGHSPWSRSEEKPAPLVLPDIASSPGIDLFRATILREGIRASALLPIASGGSLLGRLSILFNEPHPFSEEELHAGRMIAAQIALGIEKARAREELRRQRAGAAESLEEAGERRVAERRLASEHGVTRILADAHSLSEAVPRILCSLGECLGCVFAAFWRVESNARFARCTDTWQARGVSLESFDALCRGMSFERGVGLPGRVWENGTPAWISELAADRNFPRFETAASVGLRSGFAFPIKVKQHTLGIMEFFLPHRAEPDDRLLNMMCAIGSEIGQFIEKKDAEDALAASEETTRSIINAALDAVITMDASGLITGWNSQAERLFGWTADEAIGRRLDETVIPPRYRERHRAGLQRFLESGEATLIGSRVELEGLRRDGSELPVELSMTAIRTGGGYLFSAFLRDITERNREKRLLEENQLRFQMLAEEVPEILFTHDADGNLDYVSPRYFEYTGTTPDMQVEERVKFNHPEDAGRVMARWREALRLKIPYDAEYRMRGKDGAYRWFHARSVPLFDAEGRVARWFGACSDIDDQKRIAERLTDANQAKDEFLAVLAHELRNPLNPIRSAVHVMNQKNADEASLERARGIIDRQVQHMARLVDDLLDVSRISRGRVLLRRETVDLLALVSSTVEDHRSEIGDSGHTVLLDLPTEALWVSGDPTRLAQIVGNILQNANKFTEAGGTIRVRVRCAPEGETAMLSVRDSGIGIEPRMLDRVFETFAQADRSLDHRGGGLGLGLALVKGLVQLHGGSVHAYSEGLGKGSEFSIRLPLCGAPAPVPPEVTHEVPSNGHCRVLVIEDNRDSGLGMELALKLGGHVVKVACTGKEGVALAQEFHPDVVLCDIGLEGGMDGYAVARALRSDPECAGSHLVAVTGYGREEDVRRSREAGFDVHLTKPIDPEAMDMMLRGIAARLHAAHA